MLGKNCMSMGNVREKMEEYREMLGRNCMSMGNVEEELYEYGKR